MDSRALDRRNFTLRFEFGFGLTYTTFEYSSLSIELTKQASFAPCPPTSEVQQGGNVNLWTELVQLSVTMENVGSADGDKVTQLYLGISNMSARQLRGFEKVTIDSGKKTRIDFFLNRRDLSVWDAVHQGWHLQSGNYKVNFGRSCRNLPLLSLSCDNLITQ